MPESIQHILVEVVVLVLLSFADFEEPSAR